MGYYFDLVDIPGRKLLHPKCNSLEGLAIEVKYMSAMIPLLTVEEGTRQARGVKVLEGTGEERYLVPLGTKVFIYREHSGQRTHVATVNTPTFEPVDEGYVPQTFNFVRG